MVLAPASDPALEEGAAELAGRFRPSVLAGERVLAVPEPLGAWLPGGGLRRGSVTVIDGAPGLGATTLALHLLAAATAGGEWAALVDGASLDGSGVVGGLAAAQAGVVLERMGVVRRVPRSQWPVVVAALLEGTALVVAVVPRWARAGDARRLTARARERGAALVALGRWPAEATTRLTATGWQGELDERMLTMRVEARGAARTARLRFGDDVGAVDADAGGPSDPEPRLHAVP